MTSNPANVRYFKISPRGFANEVIYYKVPLDKVGEVEAFFEGFEDSANGGYCNWTTDRQAHRPGVAVDWADRAYMGHGE